MAHLISRLILIASSAFFMASPVKRRGGLVGQGFNPDMGCQLSITARGFGSCSFFDCAPGKGNYLQQKQGAGIREQGSGYGLPPRRGNVKIAQGKTLGKQCNGDVPPRRGDVKIAQGKTLGTCPHPPVCRNQSTRRSRA